MKKVLPLIIVIATVVVAAFFWYLGYYQLTYSLDSATVIPGGKIIVRYSYLGLPDFPSCRATDPIQSVKNDNGREMFLDVEAVAKALQTPETHQTGASSLSVSPEQIRSFAAQGAGFANESFYEQLKNGDTFFIVNVGKCLPATSGNSLMDRLKKQRSAGLAQTLIALPGTSLGEYTIDTGDSSHKITVAR